MAAATLVQRRTVPATLAQSDIDQTLVKLRLEREAQIKRTRALEIAAEGSNDPAKFLDLAEARGELRTLLNRWRSILAQALAMNSWSPLGSEAPRFAEIQRHGAWCQARACVPLTPDSMLFVHGPVTLWHSAALADSLLEEDDRLVCLDRCAFHRELTFEPQIAVWDEGLCAAPHGFPREDIAASGTFRTANGRMLGFAAVPDPDHIPLTRAGWHPITAALIARRPVRNREAEPKAISAQLGSNLWPGAPSTGRASNALLAKAEALLAGMTQNMAVGDRIMLLARASNITLEEDFSAWLAKGPQLQYEFDWGRRKPIRGRGAFIPFRFRVLPDETAWQRSIFICLDSHLGL